MKFCGVDNGLKGGIVFIKGDVIKFYDMPTINLHNKQVYDTLKLKEIFITEKPEYICIEKAQAFPGQGVRSMFTTGYGFGLIEGIALMLDAKVYVVHPKIWQKHFFQGQSGDSKMLSYYVASKLFPQYAKELLTPRGKIKDGLADALLIGKYGEYYFTTINGRKNHD